MLVKDNKLQCILYMYTQELQLLIDSLLMEALALKDYLHQAKIRNLTGYFEEIVSLRRAILDKIKTLNDPSIHLRVIEEIDASLNWSVQPSSSLQDC